LNEGGPLKVKLAEPKPWLRSLEFEIPPEDINKKFDEKLNLYQRQIKISGFRPGKAPLHLIKNKFSDAIHLEVLEKVIEDAIQESCKTNNLIPINSPKVDIKEKAKDKPFVFTAEFEIHPPVDIQNYKKLGVNKEVKPITEHEVSHELKHLQEKLAKFKTHEGTSEEGNFVVIDYVKLEPDGKIIDKNRIKNFPVELGSGRVKEFDEALKGCRSGDEKKIRCSFPKEYHEKELAGQPVEFLVNVKEVKDRMLPPLDDAFAQSLGDFKSLDDLKKKIKSDLIEHEEKRAVQEAYAKVIDKIIEKNPFEIPPSLVENYIDKVIEDNQRRRGYKMSREEVKKNYEALAEKEIKRYLIVQNISQKEAIQVTQDEVNAMIKKYADAQGLVFEEAKRMMREKGRTLDLRNEIQEEKTLDFLLNN